MSAVSFEAVSFSYNGKAVLGPLSLSVPAGQTLVLLGQSGSGKTTALRLVNAMLVPTSGDVMVLGKRVKEWNPVALRRSVGYMIQDVGLFPHMNVERNIGIVPQLLGWETARTAERVRALLGLLRLDRSLATRLPHELSGGQRQRVGVARALAADPPILLCDEPFGALDPFTRAELQLEFRQLVAELEKTVLFVTHDVREAVHLGDRVALLDRGALEFSGTLDEFQQSTDPAVSALREYL